MQRVLDCSIFIVDRVCGSNMVIYDNFCDFKKAACTKIHELTIVNDMMTCLNYGKSTYMFGLTERKPDPKVINS